MPGGALAVRKPYRMALGYLLGAEEPGTTTGATTGATGTAGDQEARATSFLERLDPRELALVRTQVARGLNAPVASSAGRLFDAASALLGIRDTAEYEGQAAIELELAAGDRAGRELPYRLATVDGVQVYDPRPTLAALLDGRAQGRTAGALAADFQRTIIEVTRALLAAATAATGVRIVCLSGGVFQNRRLASGLLQGLAADGFEVFINRQVPVNDGGIAYGQAAVAAARLASGAQAPIEEG